MFREFNEARKKTHFAKYSAKFNEFADPERLRPSKDLT